MPFLSSIEKRIINEGRVLVDKWNPSGDFRHACFIVFGERILCSSTNGYGTLEHAEVKTIEKFPKNFPRRKIGKCRIYVLRFNKQSSETRCSKPCMICKNYIKLSGIRKVAYTEDHMSFVYEKVEEIETYMTVNTLRILRICPFSRMFASKLKIEYLESVLTKTQQKNK